MLQVFLYKFYLTIIIITLESNQIKSNLFENRQHIKYYIIKHEDIDFFQFYINYQ